MLYYFIESVSPKLSRTIVMAGNNDNEVNIKKEHSMDPSEDPDMNTRGKVRLTSKIYDIHFMIQRTEPSNMYYLLTC